MTLIVKTLLRFPASRASRDLRFIDRADPNLFMNTRYLEKVTNAFTFNRLNVHANKKSRHKACFLCAFSGDDQDLFVMEPLVVGEHPRKHVDFLIGRAPSDTEVSAGLGKFPADRFTAPIAPCSSDSATH